MRHGLAECEAASGVLSISVVNVAVPRLETSLETRHAWPRRSYRGAAPAAVAGHVRVRWGRTADARRGFGSSPGRGLFR